MKRLHRFNKNQKKGQTIAVIGNYLPRLCGIATFTTDICEAIAGELGNEGEVIAMAMNDIPEGYCYPSRVRFEIRANVMEDYSMASDFLSINNVDAVILQHEFGIFGGASGAYITQILQRLKVPVITTLHTVLQKPTPEQNAAMKKIIKYSDMLVVMSERAVTMLKDIYNAPKEKVLYIPHGIPDLSFVDSSFYKEKFDVEGRKVILTLGLLSPDKGIEYMIDAMPEIVKEHPDVVYIVLGATHPAIKRQSGEEYRLKLQRRVVSLKMQDHVIFVDRFVSLDLLCEYLGLADLYITPYQKKEQIVSGTLSYALGTGKAVISTPYWYAEEMLANSKGVIVPFGQSKEFAKQTNRLFSNDSIRHGMRRKAYQFCRDMVWDKVAAKYLNVLNKIQGERAVNANRLFVLSDHKLGKLQLPDVDLRHFKTLSDDTGMLQHAICTTPNRHHGYCIDDNARALIVTAMWHRLYKDDSILPLMQTYLSFVVSGFNADTKRFRNFMSYSREWLEESGSEDSHARTLWALGVLVSHAPNDAILNVSARLFNDALPIVEEFTFSRAWAFSLIGIHAYLEKFGGDAGVKRYREILAERLFKKFKDNSTKDWPWCEDTITYANAKLPHALLLSGQWMYNPEMIQVALTSLEWIIVSQIDKKNDHLSIIGNDGWMRKDGHIAKFDQQPIEAMTIIEACLEAYAYSQDDKWLEYSWKALNWFLGSNDINMQLYDFSTGGCFDGLTPTGPNLNEGAESTLAWLISILAMHGLNEDILHPIPKHKNKKNLKKIK